MNTIHCGDSLTGARQFWKQGAFEGKGKYFYINQNASFIDIDSPYDSLISLYNDSLNSTYIYYGSKGIDYKTNQVNQDKNTKSLNKKAYLERAKSKSKSKSYKNIHWDAVDAYQQDSTSVSKMYKMGIDQSANVKDTGELKKLIVEKSKKRVYYQTQITQLSNLRTKYINEILAVRKSKELTLGEALATALRTQASLRGFQFTK